MDYSVLRKKSKLGMNHKHLRDYMRNMKEDYVLADCDLVIECKSFFHTTKRNCGNYTLGGEYNIYADFLKRKLSMFIDNNVTCHFIDHSLMRADNKTKIRKHNQKIKKLASRDQHEYFDSIFLSSTLHQTLTDLGIKCTKFLYEDEAREAMIQLAKKLNCPILTRNFEIALCGVSCILTGSVYPKQGLPKGLTCAIYRKETVHRAFDALEQDLIPVFFAMTDQNAMYSSEISSFFQHQADILSIYEWISDKLKDDIITTLEQIFSEFDVVDSFRETLEHCEKLCKYDENSYAIEIIMSDDLSVQQSENLDWFKIWLATQRLASVFCPLMIFDRVVGSWVIFDEEKEDAIMAAIDILAFAYGLLSGKQNFKIDVIGRKGVDSVLWEEHFDLKHKRLILDENSQNTNYFKEFVIDYLPAFNFDHLNNLPDDCKLLIISLVYYVFKSNHSFINVAYCIIMSYITLSYVLPKSQQTIYLDTSFNVIPNDDSQNNLPIKQCVYTMIDLYKYFDSDPYDSEHIDRLLLHDLAEFQHCLDNLNKLNTLCGEYFKSVIYSKTYNGPFIYNLCLEILKEPSLLSSLEKILKSGPDIFAFFNRIKSSFDACLISLR